MNRFFGMMFVCTVCATFVTGFANAEAISMNFASDISGAASAVGSNTAGVVPVGHWNDVPLAEQTNMPLLDSSGAASGLNVSTLQTFSYPYTANDAGLNSNFAQAGNIALMRGHIYIAKDPPYTAILNLLFNGTVPYSQFDLYVYYNSGIACGTQTFNVYDHDGNNVLASKTAFEAAGGDTAFVESTNGNDGNYVKFTGLTSDDVQTGFILQARGISGGWSIGYINGVQIVAVPEPASVVLVASGLFGLLAYAWRKQR